MVLCLAFSVYRSGSRHQDYTLGLGASVVNEHLAELDRLCCKNYRPANTTFEPRYWKEYWDERTPALLDLEYQGGLSPRQQEKIMIQKFLDFCQKWEDRVALARQGLVLASAEKSWDGKWINHLIRTYTDRPLLPCTLSQNPVGLAYWEAASWRQGFSAAQGWPSQNTNFMSRLKHAFDLPPQKRPTTHQLSADTRAYSVAWEYQLLQKIQRNQVVRHRAHRPVRVP